MKRPSFQFYPADWRNNAKLRRCSWAARAVWLEIMGLMHDADEYGILRWNLREISDGLGAPMKFVKELVEKGVLKGCDKGISEPHIYTPRSGRKDGKPVVLIPSQNGPIWYSSRMVEDEYKRTNSGGSTRFGAANGDEKDVSPSRRHGEGKGEAPSGNQSDGSTTSSSPSDKDSVPIGTAGEPALDPKAVLFAQGLEAAKRLMPSRSEAALRTWLGKLRQKYGDVIVIDALAAAERESPSDPPAYVAQCCERRGTGHGPPGWQRETLERQDALAEAIRQVASG